MALEISSTASPPGSVLDSLETSLKADGWQAALPTESGSRMFMKRNRIALITAQRSQDGFTRVLRLHKPLGVK